MATIKDVSRLANVSISTVSRVINKSSKVSPDKVEAVMKAMEDLNFQPNSFAQALVNKKSNCIGVLVGDLCGGPFFAQMMRGIENVILPANKFVIVMSGKHEHDREKNSIEALLLRRCDALVVHSKALSDQELIEIARSDVPIVFVNRLVPTLEDRCVWVDISCGMETAVNHLIKQGHKRIAYIASDEVNNQDAKDRMDGYRRALSNAGIEYDEDLVSLAFPDENGGHNAIESLLMRDVGFTAFVAYNDAMAVGAVSALAENNISVPEEVSAIGFDNNLITNFIKPKLTTVRYPIEEVGETAAKLALNVLYTREREEYEERKEKESNKGYEKKFDLHEIIEFTREDLKFIPDLIERDSVAPYNEAAVVEGRNRKQKK
ncbi:MAG: LacI family DNA-binding transcriptional regulator [Ruminobacter sp.]|jgi:LacI family transcriptional regulator|uniref:LacI family DNA-binding transcriptional regulator n=1 Tax=Ruminobacter sp. TaxID=2774296 RepID=UPI001B26B538|nr:LacI family DNA-binding transcriptional regulator [Ruminobacter sp.]MBO6010061.1 LacI family DNA-binding transcriptional regulator [Ruminobacter sp.]MBP3749076.1 LacI family DNA-binding transcriptional regulator [Ruminobacter sp.]